MYRLVKEKQKDTTGETRMEERQQRMWEVVGERLQAMLVSSPENVRYLCGFAGTEGTLLLTKHRSFFFTDGRYSTQARGQVHGCTIVRFKDKWKDIGRLVKKLGIQLLGFEPRHLTVAMLWELEKELQGVNLQPLSSELDGLRLIKDAGEIRILREAARIACCALQDVLPMIRPGVAERDVAAELEYRMRRHGGECAAFPTIVVSGKRSALPHGTATQKRIRSGELVTIDYGVRYHGYCSDETCTFVLGKPTAKQQQVYKTVLRAHDRALGMVAPGNDLKKIDAAARRYIERCGYQRYFPHGTGHGVGLCVHEQPVVSPRSTLEAQPGMVFTIEPGVYIPGWGGVRIEDMVLVTQDGMEVLTQANKRLQCLG